MSERSLLIAVYLEVSSASRIYAQVFLDCAQNLKHREKPIKTKLTWLERRRMRAKKCPLWKCGKHKQPAKSHPAGPGPGEEHEQLTCPSARNLAVEARSPQPSASGQRCRSSRIGAVLALWPRAVVEERLPPVRAAANRCALGNRLEEDRTRSCHLA